mmetsp:Transcript_42602/g.65331  ORF Transcript_42602/g.65331 Transcript_42602/m.65331 type:complete len:148 (-) Transcript_42602:30-473(-)
MRQKTKQRAETQRIKSKSPTILKEQLEVVGEEEEKYSDGQHPEDEEREVMMRTFASKKSTGLLGLFNRREVIIFSDGTLAYKFKKNQGLKNEIRADQIEEMERQKNKLIIKTNQTSNSKESTITLKFDTSFQAQQWQVTLKTLKKQL